MYLLGGIEFQKVFGQAYSSQSFPSVADLQTLDSDGQNYTGIVVVRRLICSVSGFNFTL